VQLSDTLFFLAGARYDFVAERIDDRTRDATNVFFSGWIDNSPGMHRVQAIKGRAALLWHPTNSLSVYGNYTQNFGVTAGLYFSGSGTSVLFIPPEKAQEWETGVKLEAPDGRGSASFALFYLNKRNISTPILEPAIDNSSIQYVMDRATNIGAEADV